MVLCLPPFKDLYVWVTDIGTVFGDSDIGSKLNSHASTFQMIMEKKSMRYKLLSGFISFMPSGQTRYGGDGKVTHLHFMRPYHSVVREKVLSVRQTGTGIAQGL